MKKLFLTLVILLFASQASGATYYVDAGVGGGDDANAGTLASPWKSVGKAMSIADANDTVYFRAVHAAHDGCAGLAAQSDCVYKLQDFAGNPDHSEPTNSGSAGNWITFETYGSDSGKAIWTHLTKDDTTNWSTSGDTEYTTFGEFVDDDSGADYDADVDTSTTQIVDAAGYPTVPGSAWSDWVGFYVYNVDQATGALITADNGNGTLTHGTIAGQTEADAYYIRCQYNSVTDDTFIYYQASVGGSDYGNYEDHASEIEMGDVVATPTRYARGFLRFDDIATNLSGETITTSTLYVYTIYDSSGRGDTDIYRVTQSWVAGEITSLIYSTGNSWTNNDGPDRTDYSDSIAANQVLDGGVGWNSITVTTAVSNWSDSTWAEQGMIFIHDDGDGGAGSGDLFRLGDENRTTTEQRPVLFVQYTTPLAANIYRKDFSADAVSGNGNVQNMVWLNGSDTDDWEILEYNEGDTIDDPDLGAGYWDGATFYYVNVGGDPVSEILYYTGTDINTDWCAIMRYWGTTLSYHRFKDLIFLGSADNQVMIRGGNHHFDFDGIDWIGGGDGGLAIYVNSNDADVYDLTIQDCNFRNAHYDWGAGDDGGRGESISVSLGGTARDVYNVTIDTCTFHDAGAADIIVLGSGHVAGEELRNWEIKDCTFTGWAGEDFIDLKAGDESSWTNSIHDNLFDCRADSMCIGSAGAAGDAAPTRWKIYNNFFYKSGNTHSSVYNTGVEDDGMGAIKLQEGTDVTAYWRVYNNVITENNGTGISIEQGAEADVYNNTLYNNGTGDLAARHSEIMIDTADAGNCNVSNNIVYQLSSYYGIYFSGDVASANNNAIISSGAKSANPVYFDSLDKTVANLNAEGWATGNISADPLFTNVASDDFRLDYNSPCEDAGTDLGSSYDDAFDPRDTTFPYDTVDQDLYGSDWEIGAFSYLGGLSGIVRDWDGNILSGGVKVYAYEISVAAEVATVLDQGYEGSATSNSTTGIWMIDNIAEDEYLVVFEYYGSYGGESKIVGVEFMDSIDIGVP